MTTAAYPNAVYLPYYMRRRERRNLTARQMDEADAIRQKLIDMARQDGYGVTYYTDANGRDMARIGRTDGTGMGFTITAKQAREWLNE